MKPTRSEGETLIDYYKKYFGVYTSLSEMTEEAKDELYLRLLIQYHGESVEDYIKRVDYLFNEVYPEFDIRYNAEFANLLQHYFRYDREPLRVPLVTVNIALLLLQIHLRRWLLRIVGNKTLVCV